VLDGPWFETLAGQEIFSSRHPFRPALGSIQPFLLRELPLLPGNETTGVCMVLTTHHCLAPRLRVSRALPRLLHVCLGGMYGVVFTLVIIITGKGKVIPLQTPCGPEGG